jgi:hypothetical protein
MNRIAVALVAAVLCASVARADVRTEEKTQVRFEGALGRMMNLFGGRAARDGIVSTVSVKGDRMMRVTGDTAQIVDLREEKIYELDLKDRSYTVTTFADMRRRLEEARRKAAQTPADGGQPQGAQEPQREMEVDFDVKESGQRRAVNGFEAREVVMTIAVREKGKTLEENGGFVLTSHNWLAAKVEAMSEVAEFDRRYAEKLAAPVLLDAQQMAAALAMYPMMQEAMAKLRAEHVNLDGTPVMTTMTFQAVASAAQAEASQESQQQEAQPRGLPGIGGLGGRLGRRIMNRGNDEKPAADAPAQPANRATVMTLTHEVLKVSPTVGDADVAIPPGFRQKS